MNDDLLDPIERQLRESGRRRLPDDGFTLRVSRALAPQTAPRPWLRAALVPASAVIGSAAAWLLAPSGTSVAQGFVDLAVFQAQTPSAFAALVLAVAMAVTAAVLVAEED